MNARESSQALPSNESKPGEGMLDLGSGSLCSFSLT